MRRNFLSVTIMSSIFSARTSSSDDVVLREVLEIHRTFSQSPVPLLAVEAIYEDMMRQKLRWHKRGSHEPDYRRKVPIGYHKCIRQIVESVLQVGYFAYTFVDDEFPLRIAHVLEVVPYVSDSGETLVRGNKEYRGDLTDADWRIVIFSRPQFAFDDGGKFAGAGLRVIQSGAARALMLIKYHFSMISNFNRRDAANSRHSGFTSTNPALTNPHGSSETWFASAAGGATSHELLADVMSGSGGVESLVRNRAEMIRKLEAESSLNRSRVTSTNAQGDLVMPRGDADAFQKEHAEFMVSDGYTLREANALLSMANSQHHFEKLENTILFLLGVPPQALGKNINSERLAASNSLTQAALRVFHGTVSRFRDVCDGLFELIPAGTGGPKGSRVAFSECLTQYDLEKLTPFISRSKLPHLYACAYDVDPSMFDAEALRTHADLMLASGGKESGSGKRKRKEETEGISPEEKEKQNASKSAKISEKEAASNG